MSCLISSYLPPVEPRRHFLDHLVPLLALQSSVFFFYFSKIIHSFIHANPVALFPVCGNKNGRLRVTISLQGTPADLVYSPRFFASLTQNVISHRQRRPFVIGIAAFLVFVFTFILYPRLDHVVATHQKDRPAAKLPEAQEDHFVLSGPTPQPGEKSAYKDQLIALGPSDLVPQNTVSNLGALKYAVFLPTYVSRAY